MSISVIMSKKLLPLSKREAQIFALIGQGLSCKQIGARLGTSHKTVNCQRETIRNKLGFASARELLIHAVKCDLSKTTK